METYEITVYDGSEEKTVTKMRKTPPVPGEWLPMDDGKMWFILKVSFIVGVDA